MKLLTVLVAALALASVICGRAESATRIADLAYIADGRDAHRLDLYLPDVRAHAPLIVVVHGGAFMQGDRRDVAGIGTSLADEGFACAVVSYRLFPDADALGATQDVARSVGWLVAHAASYGLDPTDLFLLGHSAGGQIVALLGADPRFLTSAGVPPGAVRGVVPLAGAYDVRDLSGEPDSWQKVDGHIYGETPIARIAVSPSMLIGSSTPPMLVGCATNDDPEACDRAHAFVEHLEIAGRSAIVLRAVGADHYGLLLAAARRGDPVNDALQQFVRANAVAQAAPAPMPIDALGRFEGTWESSGTMLATPRSAAAAIAATTTCAWSVARALMICQQSIGSGAGASYDVAIYTYDPHKKVYDFYNIGPSNASGSTIDVNATTITYDSTYVDHGKKVRERTLNVWDDPSHYHFVGEYSLDGGAHWTVTLRGTSTREP